MGILVMPIIYHLVNRKQTKALELRRSLNAQSVEHLTDLLLTDDTNHIANKSLRKDILLIYKYNNELIKLLKLVVKNNKFLNANISNIGDDIDKLKEYNKLIKDELVLYIIGDRNSIRNMLSYIKTKADIIGSTNENAIESYNEFMENIKEKASDARAHYYNIQLTLDAMHSSYNPMLNDIEKMSKQLYIMYIEAIKNDNTSLQHDIINQLNKIDNFIYSERFNIKVQPQFEYMEEWLDLSEKFIEYLALTYNIRGNS